MLLALYLFRVAIEDVHVGSRLYSRLLAAVAAPLLKLLQLSDPRLVEDALERFTVAVEIDLNLRRFEYDLAHQVVDVQIL